MTINSTPKPNDTIFFDVDGVLTNLNQGEVSNNLLLLLSNLIKNNFTIVLNSGRSISWLRHTVLEPLHNFNSDIRNLNLAKFFVIGEKGGTWLDFNGTTSLKEKVLFDETTQIPNKLISTVENLVESKFNETMFRDLTKKIVLTLEKKSTASMEKFQKAQEEICLELKNILSELDLISTIEIDPTTIAIDIQNVSLGKGYGVKKILNWLDQNKILTNNFFTIGDSSSDFEMAETLFQMGKPVLHVHVGETPALLKTNYPVLVTNNKYSLGTEEFLNKIN